MRVSSHDEKRERLGADLVEAIERGDASAVGSLLSQGADPDYRGIAGSPSPLALAARGNKAAIAKLLIGAGASPCAVELDEPVLYEAVRTDSVEAARVLLQAGAKPGEMLRFVVSVEMARALVSAGASPDGYGVSPDTRPLSAAVASSRTDLVEYLLGQGADVNARDAIGQRTPLMTAAERGNEGMIRLLLRHGADVNARDVQGATALHLAASTGGMQSTKALIKAGADPRRKSRDGRTPRDCARDAGSAEVAAYLATCERGR